MNVRRGSAALSVFELEARLLDCQVQRRLFGSAAAVRIGRYELEEKVGSGGEGSVFRARDSVLDRAVAIKFVEPMHHDRLRREARMLAELRHPNIVDVYDVIEGELGVGLVIEWMAGPSLEDWLAHNPDASFDEVVSRFIAVGRALVAVHDAELIHRDFKPSNVLTDENGTAKLCDFGLANGNAWTPASGGTPAFMSPEQRGNAYLDARSDQFSFALALSRALGGDASGPGATCPPGFAAALMRGLESSGDRRFSSLSQLLDTLENAGRVRRRRRATRRWIVAAAATVVALGLGWRFTATPAATPIDRATAVRQIQAEVRLTQLRSLAHRQFDGNELEAAVTTLEHAYESAAESGARNVARVISLDLAHAELELGNTEAARRWLESSDPKTMTRQLHVDVRSLLLRARVRTDARWRVRALGASQAAIAAAQQREDSADHLARAHHLHALALYRSSRHDEASTETAVALRAAENALSGHEQAEILVLDAKVSLARNDDEHSIQSARRVLTSCPPSSVACRRLRMQASETVIEVLLAGEDTDTARIEFERASREADALPPVARSNWQGVLLRLLVRLEMDLGNFDNALRAANRAADICADSSSQEHYFGTLLQRAGLLLHMDRPREALSDLNSARALMTVEHDLVLLVFEFDAQLALGNLAAAASTLESLRTEERVAIMPKSLTEHVRIRETLLEEARAGLPGTAIRR